MTALLGKPLLFAGCTAFGLLRGSRLRQRTACLGEFRRTLAGLARELAFSLRPVSSVLSLHTMLNAFVSSASPVKAFGTPPRYSASPRISICSPSRPNSSAGTHVLLCAI